MAKETTTTTTSQYGLINAIITGLISGLAALALGYLIEEKYLNHQFDLIFPYAAVGVIISILNFKKLSKIAVFVLPFIYSFCSFGLVGGALLMAYFGWEKENVNDSLIFVIENLPFVVLATFLYSWYSAMAGKKSFLIYAIFATTTVVVSMLIFDDKYEPWLIQGAYLGIGAFLFSLLHVQK